jgi:hypothetical protein
MFRDCADMPLRAAVRDDKRIGQRRAAFEIDRYDVFGLVIIEGMNDTGQERQLP